jgi:hypothetical protein
LLLPWIAWTLFIACKKRGNHGQECARVLHWSWGEGHLPAVRHPDQKDIRIGAKAPRNCAWSLIGHIGSCPWCGHGCGRLVLAWPLTPDEKKKSIEKSFELKLKICFEIFVIWKCLYMFLLL